MNPTSEPFWVILEREVNTLYSQIENKRRILADIRERCTHHFESKEEEEKKTCSLCGLERDL